MRSLMWHVRVLPAVDLSENSGEENILNHGDDCCRNKAHALMLRICRKCRKEVAKCKLCSDCAGKLGVCQHCLRPVEDAYAARHYE